MCIRLFAFLETSSDSMETHDKNATGRAVNETEEISDGFS